METGETLVLQSLERFVARTKALALLTLVLLVGLFLVEKYVFASASASEKVLHVRGIDGRQSELPTNDN